MEVVVIIGMLAVAIGMVVWSLMPKRSAEHVEAVKRRTAGLSSDEDKAFAERKAKQRASKHSMLDKAIPLLSKPVMPMNAEEQSTLRAKLAGAGFRKESAAALFLAAKTAGALVCGAIAAILAVNSDKEWAMLLGQTVFGLGLGFMLPNLWLNISVGRRSDAIRAGLPDSLDLMVVAVESGLGLDAAMQRVGEEMRNVHRELSEEFQIATVETQMGVPRVEALTKMALRTNVAEMRALVAVIAQAEKLGTSIAKALRNQAESLRTKRRQKAEERAQKTAVKLLLPLILFIFPTIFVVLVGPAAIQLYKMFTGDKPGQ
ncbi:MAG TPA: type II secretion system F family protein [Phycisphaerae bacterium]|nr:type II secretion system F family protein [Phycisphaerae bacterium]